MQLFDVYPLYDVIPHKAKGSVIWDQEGIEYLDLYGGHAVISIGHSHPHFVRSLEHQLNKIGFYSNSVQIPIQKELAQKLGKLSGYEDYELFLCNSGAEANENALKLASFATGKSKVLAFKKAFHGRTSLAVALTDNPAIVAPVNAGATVEFLPFNDLEAAEKALDQGDVAAVIIEGIQGVAGIYVPDTGFLQGLEYLSKKYGAYLILDEVQSGYGRTGKFFAHQWAAIKPDLITIAKGMGNGFPIGGVMIAPHFKAKHGMLGTTFGGNHLACAAGLAVLEVIEKENLIHQSEAIGKKWSESLAKIPGVKEVRGKGLMIGVECQNPIAPIREALVKGYKMFTGNASEKHTIRLLPALNIGFEACLSFKKALEELLAE